MRQRLPSRFYWLLARERAQAARAAAARWRRAGKAWPRYLTDARRYAQELGPAAARLEPFPQVHDRTATTPVDSHYVQQGPWVARYLTTQRPPVHVDIGSFVGYLGFFSAHAPTVFVDIRPPQVAMPGLTLVAGSLEGLPFGSRSVPSLSCLHVLEHVGLGRYGDPIDVHGTRTAAQELVRVLAEGGDLYVSLPVGRAKTYFNAHRVHDPHAVPDLFAPLRLREHAAILDDGTFVSNVVLRELAEQNYACGLYHFTR